MGWCSYHATHYKKDGYTVDRKAECDALINDENHVVLKSTMVGSVYYAAVRTLRRVVKDASGSWVKDSNGNYVREDIPVMDQPVWAAVFKTGKDDAYFNFAYKDRDETVGPCESDCPKSILDLLTPTDSQWANEWRARCYKNLELKKSRKSFESLPYGSQVRFTDWEGVEHILTKHEPAYQFKTWFWYEADRHQYVKKKLVTSENAIPVTLEEVVV